MDVGGKIKLGDVETEFILTSEGSFMQWGGTREELGDRVELLEALGEAYLEWKQENLCSECEDHLLDDGEGYDGKCGNCADRAEAQLCSDCVEQEVTDPDHTDLCDSCRRMQ